MTLAGKDPRLVPYGGGNYGTPLELVDGLIVPTPLLFVRSNGSVPELDERAWRLEIDGLVHQPLSLSMEDVQAFPTVEYSSFIECAGNSRTSYDPVAEGTPWLNDAIGCASWTGTPLRGLLDAAGVRSGAVDVVARGGDEPAMERGLPIGNALDPETLVVWAMNGQPLTVPHGAPLRLIVPRWGGIASTKWLVRLTVTDAPFTGYYNATAYVIVSERGEHLAPVREMPVKSVIVAPANGAAVPAGAVRLHGYAWSGFSAIDRVAVSVDDGDWLPATIDARDGPLAWVRWSVVLGLPSGRHVVRARATDARTLTQPSQPTWNARGYQMNAIQSVQIDVT